VSADDRRIDCYFDGSECVCFDGRSSLGSNVVRNRSSYKEFFIACG
jgi:hypothetical protein